MGKRRSFVPSDFSWGDMPGFLIGDLLISMLSIGIGLTTHTFRISGKIIHTVTF